jgi:hypothetical protein
MFTGRATSFAPSRVLTISHSLATAGVVCNHKGAMQGKDERSPSDEQGSVPCHLATEMERLQNHLYLIEALEERNKAQLESFIDTVDQWNWRKMNATCCTANLRSKIVWRSSYLRLLTTGWVKRVWMVRPMKKCVEPRKLVSETFSPKAGADYSSARSKILGMCT